MSSFLAGLSGAMSGYAGILQYEDKNNKAEEAERLKQERLMSLENLRASNNRATQEAGFDHDKEMLGAKEDIAITARDEQRTYNEGQVDINNNKDIEQAKKMAEVKEDMRVTKLEAEHAAWYEAQEKAGIAVTPEKEREHYMAVRFGEKAAEGIPAEEKEKFGGQFDAMSEDEKSAQSASFGANVSIPDARRMFIIAQHELTVENGSKPSAGSRTLNPTKVQADLDNTQGVSLERKKGELKKTKEGRTILADWEAKKKTFSKSPIDPRIGQVTQEPSKSKGVMSTPITSERQTVEPSLVDQMEPNWR